MLTFQEALSFLEGCFYWPFWGPATAAQGMENEQK